MTALGELLTQLFGWLGHLVAWIVGWCPVYRVVPWNERGVKYMGGAKPVELSPDRRFVPYWVRWLLLRRVWYAPRWTITPRWFRRLVRKACSTRGMHWYVPNTTEINTHHINRCVLRIESMSLETADDPPQQIQIGMVLTYHIVDVLKYEVENYDADESMSDVAEAGLRNIVTEMTVSQLRQVARESGRFEKMLAKRMQETLGKFGVEVETARPSDQVKLRQAMRLFGVEMVAEQHNSRDEE